MRVRVRKSLRERHFALGCRRKNKESVLRRTAESDAESWFVGVGKQSLKPKRNRLLISKPRSDDRRKEERRRRTKDERKELSTPNPLSPPLVSLPTGFFADFIRFSPRGDETDMTNRRYTVRKKFLSDASAQSDPGTAALFTADATIKKREKKERKENDGALVFPEIGAPP